MRKRLAMRQRRIGLTATCLFALAVLLSPAALYAQSADQPPAGTYSLLYSFQCTPDGANPDAGLVRDSAGNLYGTTIYGGRQRQGTVFKVTPDGTESVLHSFVGPPSDGHYPELGSLTLDAAGNIYGTTYSGGEFYSDGTVFKVTPTGTESILYNFCEQSGCTDGRDPIGGVVRDSAGNLYGTTQFGGASDTGALFKLTPGGAESVIHGFPSYSTDGVYPTSNLTRDSSGNLYGTTEAGGIGNSGTVFEVTASGTESLLYSFKGYPTDGEDPNGGGLLRDTAGNLYGVTEFGGPSGAGVLFKLTPGGRETVLVNFNDASAGRYPFDGLVNAAGNLYGTALQGGSGGGVLFELTPGGQEIVLHDFIEHSVSDGSFPPGGVIRDPSGNLYGTLYLGGAYGCGAVFKYTP